MPASAPSASAVNIFNPEEGARSGAATGNIDDEIDELRATLVKRRQRLKLQQKRLLSERAVPPQAAAFDIDSELQRLEQTYDKVSLDGPLQVDKLLESITNASCAEAVPQPEPKPTVAAPAPAPAPTSQVSSPSKLATSLGIEGYETAGLNASAPVFRAATGSHTVQAPEWNGTSGASYQAAGAAGNSGAGNGAGAAEDSEGFLAMVKTLPGSKRLQLNLDELLHLRRVGSNSEQRRKLEAYALRVFAALQGNLTNLMRHRSANFGLSRLFEVLGAEDRQAFLGEIRPAAARISRHQSGTFALQKVLSMIDDPEQVEFLASGLVSEVRSLATNQHATYMLQKLLACRLRWNASPLLAGLLADDAAASISRGLQFAPEDHAFMRDTANNKFGAMLLTAALQECTEEQVVAMVQSILPALPDVACNEFGNYVVQRAFGRCAEAGSGQLAQMLELMLEALTGNPLTVLRTATDEYGVKVLLTALGQGAALRVRIVSAIFELDAHDQPNPTKLELTRRLMFSSSGAVLLKRAIKTSTSPAQARLLMAFLRDLLRAAPSTAPEYARWVDFLN